jgi:group II intron reverse transcriptase/maturase
MNETQGSNDISTRLRRIAELARRRPQQALTTLAHHIDKDFLREAYRRTRKDGAPGVDGRSAAEYAQNLEANLEALLERAKDGSYWAPPVRRVYIPKSDGKKRALGIPTFEDKVLQRAIAMVLEAVYEQDFLGCSYGFRPGRSAHLALEAVRDALMKMRGGWVIEVDIRNCFDTVDHGKLREILNQRVRDGVLLRLIGKWLNAGVLEEGKVTHPDAGTPQGGVISPLLANIYLHEVIDRWFVDDVLPRLRGRAEIVRYADDMVLVFEREDDARRVFEALAKRFEKHGLSLHPAKTRLIEFRRPPHDDSSGGPSGFDFLGFTHHWARSRKGAWVVKRRTAKDRYRRTLRRLHEWCREHRHAPVQVQQRALNDRLRGHYQYFGITGNFDALDRLYRATRAMWRRWLGTRSQRARMTWARFYALLERLPLATPRIVHRYVT